MARLISTTVRLEEEDIRALRRARAAGHSASALIRKGLRVVASRYYTGRRPPSTRLFESTDNKLGDESELFPRSRSLSRRIVADTGGLLRGLASTKDGKPSFPEYEKILTSATLVIVPGLVPGEVDYFLRANRVAMRKLVAEIFDPATRYEYELPLPSDIVRALELDARFANLNLGLVDGTVVAVAERRRVYRVLTTDRRDFAAVRVGPRLTRALEILP
jgi:predicted nucleic acid-binding protein